MVGVRYIIGPDGIPYGPFADAKPTPAEVAAREFAALDAMIREEYPRPGDCEPDPVTEAEEEFADMMFRADPSIAPKIGSTRTCPGCGRPQHYTGAEAGWCHDALVDTWHCADPRKAGA